jgi:hypothetical protein
VLERLERIRKVDGDGADPRELISELRALVREAEAWTQLEGGDAEERAVATVRDAITRDMIAV